MPTPKKKSEYDDELAKLKMPISFPDDFSAVDESILNDKSYVENLVRKASGFFFIKKMRL